MKPKTAPRSGPAAYPAATGRSSMTSGWAPPIRTESRMVCCTASTTTITIVDRATSAVVSDVLTRVVAGDRLMGNSRGRLPLQDIDVLQDGQIGQGSGRHG